jgi:nucleoside-diphosphate-sugar epimerase
MEGERDKEASSAHDEECRYHDGASIWSNDPLKVVITGGCGFIAIHIARALYMETPRIHITLLDVEGIHTDDLKFITDDRPHGGRIEYRRGSVLLKPNLRDAIEDADVVIHCANKANFPPHGSENIREMEVINVQGTKNLIDVCKKSETVKALIYVGSIAQAIRSGISHQENLENIQANEDDELLVGYYGYTKNIAERMILQVNGYNDRLYTCSLRVPFIYGERDTTFIPGGTWAARRYLCCCYVQLGRPSAKMTAIYAGNVGWAHVCALNTLLDGKGRCEAGGRVFYITDDTPVQCYCKFVRQILTPAKMMIVPVRLPLALMMAVLHVMIVITLLLKMLMCDVSSAWCGINWLMEMQQQLKIVNISYTISRQKAEEILNYHPKISFEVAFDKSVTYYNGLKL